MLISNHKKEFAALAFSIFIFVLSLFSYILESENAISGWVTSPTGLFVTNQPPNLTSLIPNQTILANNNKTNAFDLDDYFFDVNHDDSLVFNYSGNSQVTIIINSSNGVSFYPSWGFEGIEYVIFIASDGEYNTTSNNISLNVSSDADIHAPQWSNVLKNESSVIQNQNVLFSTAWTDNTNLAGYIFALNQAGSFLNESYASFTGTSNTSSVTKQINASSGSTVYWYFFANDTSGNSNQTSVQSFTVSTAANASSSTTTTTDSSTKSKKAKGKQEETSDEANVAPTAVGDEEESEVEESFIKNEAFSIKPDLLDMSLKPSETKVKSVEIENIGDAEINIYYNISGSADKFAKFFEPYPIKLIPGQKKNFFIEFTAENEFEPDIYSGKLVFYANTEDKGLLQLPVDIVIELNPFDSSFGINVTIEKKFKNIAKGDDVEARIEIKSTKDPGQFSGQLYYEIRDIEDNILDSMQEEMIVRDVAMFTRKLFVPSDAKIGNYIFLTRFTYANQTSLGHDTFKVTDVMFIIKEVFLGLGVLIIAGIIVAYLVYSRGAFALMKRKNKLLKLYYGINEAKKLIDSDKIEDAGMILHDIKKSYGEKITKEQLGDKDFVVKEINKMHSKLTGKLNLVSKKMDSSSEILSEEKNNVASIEKAQDSNESQKENKDTLDKEINPKEKSEIVNAQDKSTEEKNKAHIKSQDKPQITPKSEVKLDKE